MITSSGPKCDVCGAYILPLASKSVNHFTIEQAPGQTFHCHDACKQAVLDCQGDWTKLPSGPLRKAYEEADSELKRKDNTP